MTSLTPIPGALPMIAPRAPLAAAAPRVSEAADVPAPVDALDPLRALERSRSAPGAGLLETSLRAATLVMQATSGLVHLPGGVPTLLIPDLHARRDFLLRALGHEVGGERAIDALAQGRLNVVCLGDGMHAEGRAADRWKRAEEDHQVGRRSAAMNAEMAESLNTMRMIMDLKCAYPAHFHFLRGNHEDVRGRDWSKYAHQTGDSRLVREWMVDRYGDALVDEYAAFERAMPLMARGENFVASHAAPAVALTREAIEARSERAFTALTWTHNLDWQDDDPTPRATVQHLLAAIEAPPTSHWVIGHRHVDEGLYRSQLDGQLVQINAQNDCVVALIGADGRFDPARDVCRV